MAAPLASRAVSHEMKNLPNPVGLNHIGDLPDSIGLDP